MLGNLSVSVKKIQMYKHVSWKFYFQKIASLEKKLSQLWKYLEYMEIETAKKSIGASFVTVQNCEPPRFLQQEWISHIASIPGISEK